MTIEDELRRAAVLIPGSDIEGSIPLVLITDVLAIVKKYDHDLAKKLEEAGGRIGDGPRFAYDSTIIDDIIVELRK